MLVRERVVALVRARAGSLVRERALVGAQAGALLVARAGALVRELVLQRTFCTLIYIVGMVYLFKAIPTYCIGVSLMQRKCFKRN